MSISSLGPTSGRIGGQGDSASRVAANPDRQISTHEPCASFAKLLDGLSQTTAPTTKPGAGGVAATPASADVLAQWARQQTAGGTSELRGAIDPASTAALAQVRLK